MALNAKKIRALNEVPYSSLDGSSLFYTITNSGDKDYNIQFSNLFLATNNLSTLKFANNTLQISDGALSASGTFNLSGTLNTGNTAITGTLNVSGTSTLRATNVTGALTATSLVKSGGTSSQFLKADGSIDENSYLITESFNESLLGNGWTELPNGLIFQWMTGATGSVETSYTSNFPRSFPNACLHVQLTTKIPSGGDQYNCYFELLSSNRDSTTYYLQRTYSGGEANHTCLIFAIGY